jgi:hypothetical protein
MPDFGLESVISVEKDLGYQYPNGYPPDVDLSPDSELHQGILKQITQRTAAAQNSMSVRYPTWEKMDWTFTGFVNIDVEEKAVKDKDDRKPVSIVIPSIFAIREALLAFISSSFLGDDIYFGYEGIGPEDTIGAILMQHIVQQHLLKTDAELAMHTQWKDALTYGLGIVTPIWRQDVGPISRRVADGFTNPVNGNFIKTGEITTVEDGLIWEGSELLTIDPYRYLPDPNVAVQDVQKGEFVAWTSLDNKINLQEFEDNGTGGYFNVRYIGRQDRSQTSILGNESGRQDKYGRTGRGRAIGSGDTATNPVNITNMYIKLVPKRWGLGTSERVEKWLFTVANERVIIRANPVGLDHNLFPIAVVAPDFDGYSPHPIGRMEVIFPMQEYENWLMSSHITNKRKAINNTFLIDPFRVNMNDVLSDENKEGGFWRMRRSSWGKGVQGAVEQLKVNDVTQNNVNEAGFINNMMEQITGASNPLQGVFDTNAPERRTATEVGVVSRGLGNRLDSMLRIINSMSQRRLGRMLAAHTKQLLSTEQYIKLTGDWERILVEQHGKARDVLSGRMLVRPMDIDVNTDVNPISNRSGADADAQSLLSLFQIAATNPRLSRSYDMMRIYETIARRLGEKNIQDFRIQVQPTGAVQAAAQEGTLQAV